MDTYARVKTVSQHSHYTCHMRPVPITLDSWCMFYAELMAVNWHSLCMFCRKVTPVILTVMVYIELDAHFYLPTFILDALYASQNIKSALVMHVL